MVQSVKIAVSLPEELLREIDMISKNAHISRSATFREALQMLVEKYRDAESLKKAKRIYQKTEMTDRNLSVKFARLSSKTLPAYESQGEK